MYFFDSELSQTVLTCPHCMLPPHHCSRSSDKAINETHSRAVLLTENPPDLPRNAALFKDHRVRSALSIQPLTSDLYADHVIRAGYSDAIAPHRTTVNGRWHVHGVSNRASGEITVQDIVFYMPYANLSSEKWGRVGCTS